MDTKAAIKAAIDTANMISTSYLGDLTDEEMMHRPAPSANHIKWQVGHLIASEFNMINQVAPGKLPALPDGFADKYNCLLYTSPSPRDKRQSRMPSSA